MNRIPESMSWKSVLTLSTLALAVALLSPAQDNALQEKVAAVKLSMATNTQRLHQYQWTETTQLTLNGDPKPPSQNLCQYGPDGQVHKTPLGPPPEQPGGGRIKQRVIEKKKEEMQQYMGEVKGLVGMYVPPDPQKIEQAQQAGKISLDPAGFVVNLVLTDYVQPGDQMTLAFDTNARRITGLNVKTYMGQTKDKVSLQVQMFTLPDGTNYVQQTVLNASAKKLSATTTNSDYRKLAGF
jgi:hypothetical protein